MEEVQREQQEDEAIEETKREKFGDKNAEETKVMIKDGKGKGHGHSHGEVALSLFNIIIYTWVCFGEKQTLLFE